MSTSIQHLVDNIRSIIWIDRSKLEYILASLIAGGHVMLADSHGVGKTSLAKALALSFRRTSGDTSSFNRIQCTVDLLPQDILGYTRIDSSSMKMTFMKGPIFTRFLLCDEINLLPPKTQGSFFQAMEEGKVTVEGTTWDLPEQFFLISTMNLQGAHLFPLPLPQLDRFMIQISLGFPNEQDEYEIIRTHGQSGSWNTFCPVADEADIVDWRSHVETMQLHPDVLSYIVAIVRSTRETGELATGASPRSGIKLSRLARALAFVRGEEYVTADLVKELAIPTLAHRLESRDPERPAARILSDILETLPVDGHAKRLKRDKTGTV